MFLSEGKTNPSGGLGVAVNAGVAVGSIVGSIVAVGCSIAVGSSVGAAVRVGFATPPALD